MNFHSLRCGTVHHPSGTPVKAGSLHKSSEPEGTCVCLEKDQVTSCLVKSPLFSLGQSHLGQTQEKPGVSYLMGQHANITCKFQQPAWKVKKKEKQEESKDIRSRGIITTVNVSRWRRRILKFSLL